MAARWILALVVVALLSSSSSAVAADLTTTTNWIPGAVVDVTTGSWAGTTGVLVSHTDRGRRRLSFVDVDGAMHPAPSVPATAIAAALCGDSVVFAESRGLVSVGVDGTSRVLIASAPLFAVPDAEALPFAPLCPSPNERLLLVAGGIAVVQLDGAGAVVDERILAFAHRARAYGGHNVRSLRSDRPYSTALSLYAPWFFCLDVNGDGRQDLVVVHERRLAVFVRAADGRLTVTPIQRDLGTLVGAPDGADLRVMATSTSSLMVVASEGPLPERTVIAEIVGSAEAPLSRVVRQQRLDGLGLLLGLRGRDPLVARIDTSLMSLSGMVLTGRVSLEVIVGTTAAMTLPLPADVRAGRIEGALPVVDVDLTGDGVADIVDLGVPGRAGLWRADGAGFVAMSPVVVPRLDWALGAPALGRVIVIGRGGQKGTSVTLLGPVLSSPRRQR